MDRKFLTFEMAFTSAPLLIKAFATARKPLVQAAIRGVIPPYKKGNMGEEKSRGKRLPHP